MAATLQEIENLLNAKLSPIISQQNKIMELLYAITNTQPITQPENITGLQDNTITNTQTAITNTISEPGVTPSCCV